MKKFNFNVPLLDIKGQPQEVKLSDLLSNLLMQSSAKPPLSAKYFLWAMNLAKGGLLEVDDIDEKSLITFISEYDNLTVLGRGRLLEVFNDSEA